MLVRTVPKINIFEPFLWVFYTWYYFPIARAFFKSGFYNQVFFAVFGCGCLLCVLQFLLNRFKVEVKYTPLIPVLLYILMFSALWLFEIGDAGRHIRISFTFWGSLIIFYLSGYFPSARKRLGKLMLILFLITIFTSVLGVVSIPSAARILTYAANDIEEDLVIRMFNIGGISFFQGLVICVPILITFIFKKKYVVFSIVLLVTIFVGILSASFTISILLFFIALVMGYLFNNNSWKQAIILIGALIVVLLVPWDKLFYGLSEIIDNDIVAQRFESIASTMSNNALSGNLKSRVDLYVSSLNVFLNHPFGVGAQYSYVTYDNGIGYHSQMLDDLARYGILAVGFYIAFFSGYFSLLKQRWAKLEMSQIAVPVTILYILFLIFNLGFTSAHESVLMLLIIPTLPELIPPKSGGRFHQEKK